MRAHINLAFAAAFALAFSIAGQASAAATYTATYTGSVTGADTNGLFGPTGGNLDGASFTATFTYDPTLGTRTTYAGTDQVVGGSQSFGINLNPTTSPILSSSLTINGVSVSLDSSQYGLAEAEGHPSAPTLLETVYTFTASSLTGALVVGVADPALSVLADLTKGQSYSTSNNPTQGGFLYDGEYLALTPKTVAISAGSPPTSVPEPGSLALMASAVGLLAFTRRRRSI